MRIREDKVLLICMVQIKYLVILTLIVSLIIPFTEAYQLEATIKSQGLNLTINASTGITLDKLRVNATYIRFEGLRQSASDTENMTFNLTEINKSYTASQLPYFSGSSSSINHKIITISSGLDSDVNVTALVETHILRHCILLSGVVVSHSNKVYSKVYSPDDVTCSGNIMIINDVQVSNASNATTIDIVYIPDSVVRNPGGGGTSGINKDTQNVPVTNITNTTGLNYQNLSKTNNITLSEIPKKVVQNVRERFFDFSSKWILVIIFALLAGIASLRRKDNLGWIIPVLSIGVIIYVLIREKSIRNWGIIATAVMILSLAYYRNRRKEKQNEAKNN